MALVVTVGIMALLFKPRWLDNIQPKNPVARYAGDVVYPPSRLTAKVVTSDEQNEASGTIVTRDHQRSIEAARCARKARMREVQYAGRTMADRMDAKAERRAAKEARRIMMARRQQIMAAFTVEEE